MDWIWHPLIGNLAVSALVVSIWVHTKRHLGTSPPLHRQIEFGTFLGIGAVVIMLLSVEVYPGVHFDLRASLVGVAALFGGPVAAVLGLLLPLIYRMYLGGGGTLAGLTMLAASTIMGLAGHFWFRRRALPPSAVVLLSCGIAIFTLLGHGLLPGGATGGAWLTVAVPVCVLSFAGTFLAGYFILVAEVQAHEREILTAAFAQTPDFTYVKDRDGRFISVNEATARLHGFNEPDQMIGLTDFDLTHPARARTLFEAEQASMANRSPINGLEETLTDEDGEDRCYKTSKTPLIGQAGAVVGIVGVTRDITRDKQIAADLRESRNRLDHVMTEMADGIAMFHKEGTLMFSNERYRDLFPLTKAVRRPGMELRDILQAVHDTREQSGSVQDYEAWANGIMHDLKHGGTEQVEMYDGRWLEVRTRPSLDATSIVIVSDITQAKRLELDLRSTTEKLKHLAEVDALTDLANRRTFDEVLGKEIARTGRSGTALSLLMIDVDRFKAYNDAYGHLAGDECLRIVARCLKDAIKRPMDLAARYGGEEFGIVLPDTDGDGAYHVALSIVHEVRKADLQHQASEKGRVTVSIGVASYRQGLCERSAADLVSRADDALYGAKAAGRDRVHGRVTPGALKLVRHAT